MELPGSTYLYTLATIAITFVGFSTLMMIFRQTTRGDMTKFDVFFTISFIQQGFMVIVGSLLPPLLILYELSQDMVWRISSAFMAIVVILFVVTFPARRRAVAHNAATTMPKFAWALLAVRLLAGIYLSINAASQTLELRAGHYAMTMTVILVAAGLAYLFALNVQLGSSLKQD